MCLAVKLGQPKFTNSVVKIEAEGNRDITVAPLRLESITIRHGKVLDALAFTYKDCHGLEHTTGQWGGDGGNSTTITLGPAEFVTGVHGLYGFYGYIRERRRRRLHHRHQPPDLRTVRSS
ncbi:protein GOS9-like [Panicum miliaceum]|uniref:Protein GOS9-like n=1 Tax=Panicum miliaceum TaxID=4540 RepID=A0A3L6SVH7_PANMI|nr:protein GOS9-like [Panicum miliaceum]